MNINIKLAPILRKSTDGHETVAVNGANPLECLQALELQYPSIRRWLYKEQGEIRSEVIVFINGERVFTEELSQLSKDGDEIFIMLAIAGG